MGPSLSLGGRGDVSTPQPSFYSHTHTHTHTHSRTRAREHVRVTRACTLAVGQSRALEKWCPCSLYDRDVEIHLHIHVHAHAHTHGPHARAHGQLVKAQHWRALHYLLSVLPNSAFSFKCSAAEVAPPTVAMLAEATAPETNSE